MKRLLLIVLFIFANGVMAQEDDPIQIDVYGETGEGYIYIAPFNRARPEDVPEEQWQTFAPRLLVLDNDANILFSQVLPRRASGFRALPDGSLFYHDRTELGIGGGVATDGPYIRMTSEGEVIQTYEMVGYTTTLHEAEILDNGNAMMFSYDVREMDMTDYGGYADAQVVNTVIQEVTPQGEVVWEWSGWDHFSFEDTARPRELSQEIVDFIHSNALEFDLDGNLILSSKHTDGLSKINRATGEIMWHMGGESNPRNEFMFIDDPLNGFSAQHSITVLPNGNYLLLDNGTTHEPPLTRAVEYAIDEENRTATLVWSYDNGQFARGMGSVQRLENGNTFIGWGSAPDIAVSEVTPEGEVVLELRLMESRVNFQAFRLPFEG